MVLGLTISRNARTVCNMTPNTTNTTKSKHRLTLFVNPAIAKHAKAQALIEDLTLTQLVEKALLEYLPKEIVIKKPNILIINKRKL